MGEGEVRFVRLQLALALTETVPAQLAESQHPIPNPIPKPIPNPNPDPNPIPNPNI